MEESMKRVYAGQEAGRKHNTIILGALKVDRR
jgi:hypothetical protein